MVSNESSSGSISDLEMMSVVDDGTEVKNLDGVATAKMTACPHCSFSCQSIDVLVRHSWEEHPLLMRRKKHLITSRKTDVKMDNKNEEHDHNSFQNGDAERIDGASSVPVLQTTIKMEECRLSVGERETKQDSPRRDNVTAATPQVSTTPAQKYGAEGSVTSLPTTSTWVCAPRPPSQQRHIAVVKPVPVENKPREVPKLQPMDLFTQSMLRNKLVYAPLYSVYIPALNQYVTVPIPVGTPTPLPNQGFLGQNVESFKNFIATQQAEAQLGSARNQVFPSAQAHSQSASATSLPATWHGSPTVPEFKPLNAVYPQQRHPQSLQNTPSYTLQQQTVKSLLQRDNPCVKSQNVSDFYTTENTASRFYTPTKTERVGLEREPFPTTKQRKIFRPEVKPQDTPLIGKERLQALENALKMTDCCDITNTSSTMPFQCPDGVWRMVTFKCIRGVWLVQIPGYSTPIAYIPCDSTAPPEFNSPTTSQEFPPCGELGRKRKLSEPAGSEKCDVAAKRSCASAPNPSAQTEQRQVPRIEIMKRALSGPLVTKGLTLPCRYFTNNEGRKVNISMIKKAPSAAPSSGLIKSLLMRKPISGFRNLTHPAPLSSDSLAY